MTDHPIIFSAPMVKALLAGTKTMTRRLAWNVDKADQSERKSSIWQRVKIGDRLWVRENMKRGLMENFLTGKRETAVVVAYYSADDEEVVNDNDFNLAWIWPRKNLPSIHMPRAFSRLTLEVTAAKIESLDNISEIDAEAEGVERLPAPIFPDSTYRRGFVNLWRKLHGPESWDANPEVVALTFKVHQRNIDQGGE